MKAEEFCNCLKSEFYTGVPDSLLAPFCNFLMKKYGISENHIIAANEGNCVGLAAGYYLSTGKIPVVYLQNSGIGNVINPLASLMHDKVYGIPCIFIIGWRGEPGVHDEPQHIYQGMVTLKLLEDMEIKNYIITKKTTEEELSEQVRGAQELLNQNKRVAFVIKKGALENDNSMRHKNNYKINREEAIEYILQVTQGDAIVSTTGKISRELFEIREKRRESHKYDFLTVGSMGHSSSIALSIALNKPKNKVWCIDGDGAALMHMGALALVGANAPANMVHIIINNESHETVGGLPTVAGKIDFQMIAKGCGYSRIACVTTLEELKNALLDAKKSKVLYFIEIKVALGSRQNLGRPTTTAEENKKNFMQYLKELK